MTLENGIPLLLAGLFALFALLFLFAQPLKFPPSLVQERWSLWTTQLIIVGAVFLPARLGDPWVTLTGGVLLFRGLYELKDLWRGMPKGGVPFSLAALLFTILVTLTTVLGRDNQGFAHLMWVYLLTEIWDIGSYLVGKCFGRHYPFPRLSPGKSVEGFAGGLLAALGLGALLNSLFYHYSWGDALKSGLAIVTLGVMGDLTTSFLKRRAGRKDFAPLSRHHGGVLDIYDAFLFAAPAYTILLL